jgi:hypothetical protein
MTSKYLFLFYLMCTLHFVPFVLFSSNFIFKLLQNKSRLFIFNTLILINDLYSLCKNKCRVTNAKGTKILFRTYVTVLVNGDVIPVL